MNKQPPFIAPPAIPAEVSAFLDATPLVKRYVEQLHELLAYQGQLLAAQQEQIAALEAAVQGLREQLQLDSHNSSKPPSSDQGKITKSRRGRSHRKPGGQAGHRGSNLAFSEQVDEIQRHRVDRCSGCGHDLSLVGAVGVERRQVFELPPLRLQVTEHQGQIKYCPLCAHRTRAVFPGGVDQPTQYGPRVKSLLVYLNNYQLLPYQRISELFSDLFGQGLSVGTIYQANQRCYEQLAVPEESIKRSIRSARVAHFDETGVYQNGRGIWLHSASTPQATYYFPHPKRGRQAMDAAAILPDFKGVAVHDHWSSYRHYEQCRHSYCNAHHLRELIRAKEQDQQAWAGGIKALLLTIKNAVDQAKARGQLQLDEAQQQAYLSQYRKILQKAYAAYPNPPPSPPGKRGRKKQSKSKNLLDRLIQYETETLRFMIDFRVPFDNNLAERDLRMVKVKQKISGGFRTPQGSAMFCRIRGVISTWRKQSQDILENLTQALQPPCTTPEIILPE